MKKTNIAISLFGIMSLALAVTLVIDNAHANLQKVEQKKLANETFIAKGTVVEPLSEAEMLEFLEIIPCK